MIAVAEQVDAFGRRNNKNGAMTLTSMLQLLETLKAVAITSLSSEVIHAQKAHPYFKFMSEEDIA